MERAYDGSDMAGLGSFEDSTSKRVLDLQETGLRLREFIVWGITVIKFGVDYKGSNGTSS